MSTYKVKKYEPKQQAHYLVEKGDNDNDGLYVDLSVIRKATKTPEDLVGKKVEIGRLKPYLSIANDVEVIEESIVRENEN